MLPAAEAAGVMATQSDCDGAAKTAAQAAGGGGGWNGAEGFGGALSWSNHHCSVASQPSPAGGGGMSTQDGCPAGQRK